MSSHVLTTSSTVSCGHPPGHLTFGPATTNKLRIGGAFALVKDDVVSAAVAGCATKPSSSTVPCASVASCTGGEATKLKVQGKPVLLAETIQGVTGGTPAGALSVVSIPADVQQKLTAC